MNILAINRQSKNALTHRFSFFNVIGGNAQDITKEIAQKLNLRVYWQLGKPYLNIKGERWTAIHYLMKNYEQKTNQKINYKEC